MKSLRDAIFRPKTFFGGEQLEQAPLPALVCASASTTSFLGVALSGNMPSGFEIGSSFWVLVVFGLSFPLAYFASGVLHAASSLGRRERWRYRRALVVFSYSQVPLFFSTIPYLGDVAGIVAFIWLMVAVRYAYASWLRAILFVVGIQIVLAVGVAIGVRMLVVEAFRVPSEAMLPTFESGDHLFVNKWSWALGRETLPHRGDVVVFQYPYGEPPMHFVKRVIALPGETVEIQGGVLFVNGKSIPRCEAGDIADERGDLPSRVFVEFLGSEPHLIQTITMTERDDFGLARNWGPFTVPEREVFVMGDNRDASSDSTRWRDGAGGGVPLSLIKGRVMLIWLPAARVLFFPGSTAAELTMGLPDLEPSVRTCLEAR